MLREEADIVIRAESLKHRLLGSLQQRGSQAEASPEHDLLILSLLDQLETLLWVLEETNTDGAIH